jgi:alkaline phosphatase D
MNRHPSPDESAVPRRQFFADGGRAAAWVMFSGVAATAAEQSSGPHQASGVRIGEVTPDSATIWTRLTRLPERNNRGVVIPGRAANYRGKPLPTPSVPVDELEGACPAAAGVVRVRYGTDASLNEARSTEWRLVSEAEDGIRHFVLDGLKPGTAYHFAAESAATADETVTAVVRGQFRTAPPADEAAHVRFCVMSCQGYPDRGHPDGHGIYPAMLSLDPDFTCLTGDLVYYDNDMPRATTARLARYHWERMFSLPRLREFCRRTGAYWLKDDHDTLDNDSWPGRKMGELTFEQGQRIFKEQAPMREGPAYRTYRWGRDVQIWLTEGRDYRTPNKEKDGAEKTILGAEQKTWLKQTLLASDATWKVLVSPTPYVGPDRPQGKSDNHANVGFQQEGDELRSWFAEHLKDSFVIICGDRHWQYHSVHPETGLHEFSVGAASDEHAGGSPGEDPRFHKYHRVRGGFLSVHAERKAGVCELICRHHDVMGAVQYEFRRERKAG